MVHIEPEQGDEGFALLHHHRHGRRHHVSRVGAENEVDLVDIEELRIDARYRRRVRLIIVVDELDRPPEQAALGIGLLLPDFHAEQRLLAVGGERTGQRHPKSDLDRFAGLRGSVARNRRRRHEREQDSSDAFEHVVPPSLTFVDFILTGMTPEPA